MPLILPWDAARLEREARRADESTIARAATPYARAGERVRGSLMSASAAANPTRGAAGAREAMLAAAPTLGALATAGADATNAARAQATRNTYERDRARSENAAQLLGLGLNAGGAVGGMLTSALGGGAPTPGAAPAPSGLGSLLGAAAPIAGMAVGGPAGGMAGGALGSMLSGAATTAPERATIASSLGGAPAPGGLWSGAPAAAVPTPMAPIGPTAVPTGLAPRPIAPGGLGSTPSGLAGLPGAGTMSEEELRRLGLIGGGY